MKISAVLDYHMSPMGCGVSKFNFALAKRLGVPCLPWESRTPNALLSIKCAELADADVIHMPRRPYDLMLHDSQWPIAEMLVARARRVYAANSRIADAVRSVAPEVVTAFCPSTIEGRATRGAYRVLCFGMAHKLLLPHFEELKQRLEIEHPDYTIELSTAVHEGSPWDKALTESVEAMRGIFGDRLRVLGFLGDDALAKELREVDAVAAYYTPALRANNTTAWAALEAGKQLYTNTDADSPPLDPALHSWDMLCALIKGAA